MATPNGSTRTRGLTWGATQIADVQKSPAQGSPGARPRSETDYAAPARPRSDTDFAASRGGKGVKNTKALTRTMTAPTTIERQNTRTLVRRNSGGGKLALQDYSNPQAPPSDRGEESPGTSVSRSPSRVSFSEQADNFEVPTSPASFASGSSIGFTPASKQFYQWVASNNRWELVKSLFIEDDKHQYVVGGAVGRKGMSKVEWMQHLRSLGYQGNCHVIFDEVVQECRNDMEDKRQKQYDQTRAGRPVRYSYRIDTITLAQLRRYEGRLAAMARGLQPGQDAYPIDRFIKLLKDKRGQLLRAWRLDLDVRGAGRVAYIDFAQNCRRLGIADEARTLWNALCPDGRPLDFARFGGEEANNLEAFAEALWHSVGFDLQKAWSLLDVGHQHWLSEEEFERGVRKLGFEGNAQILFRGLDTSGLGRVWQTEFDYLQKVTQIAQRTLHYSSNVVNELISWVQREQGGAAELLAKIGLGGAVREISVGDLAARLAALGFEGDARGAAVRAARNEGGSSSGTQVSLESLEGLLSGVRSSLAPKHGKMGTTPKRPVQRAQPGGGMAKQVWKDGVDNISDMNQIMPKGVRAYFSNPERAKTERAEHRVNPKRFVPLDRTASRRGLPEEAPPSTSRSMPSWDNSLTDASELNSTMTVHSRRYFSNFSDKPVKEQLKNRMTQSARDLREVGSPTSPQRGRLMRQALDDAEFV
mmetsp:Transcript_47642/g.101943  ORF Transcript_47642/g.101943 Transcript_47642/m.101943 type:complete len:701 (+) Transcript_47642:57-2159(+)